MSLGFIFDLIIVFCLGAMLYMIARILPKVDDRAGENPGFKTPKLLIFLEKADERFKKSREKFLRRLRVAVLKFDNYLSDRLNKFKKNGEKSNSLRFELDKKKREKEDDGFLSAEDSGDKEEGLEEEGNSF